MFTFDHFNPQTKRQWALCVLMYWPIAPIWIVLWGVRGGQSIQK